MVKKLLMAFFVLGLVSSACADTKVKDVSGGSTMKSDEKPNEKELKKKLTPLQYTVTQKEGTEPPFQNEYWDNKKQGIYVDIVTGEALFSSLDKFDSGTGWPSFTQPLSEASVAERQDGSHLMSRTEVHTKEGGTHLGHVFPDGPGPTGQRYCINSASLRFIPVENLEKEGYGKYLPLFSKETSQKEAAKATLETAILAGGCFWGMEDIIRKIPGVVDTEVGYTGGKMQNPTYRDMTTGKTGHAEAIRVDFDPAKLSYEELLDYFFRLHDPTTLHRQGNDIGTQYRSAIFYNSDEQKKTAEKVKLSVNASGKWARPIVTEIVPAGSFYPAEKYHQDYLQKNPGGYTCHFLRPK